MTNQVVASENLKWIIVEQNKWALKISDTNYMFVIVNPLEDGKYSLKYLDADLKDYTAEEKKAVRNKFGIKTQANRELALKVMEHFGHYEWIEILPNKQALYDILTNATSFDLYKLRQLVEYNELNGLNDEKIHFDSEKDNDSETFNLWARVGVSVKVSKEDLPKFLENQEKFIREGLDNGKAFLDGETYFPDEVEENDRFMKKHGEI